MTPQNHGTAFIVDCLDCAQRTIKGTVQDAYALADEHADARDHKVIVFETSLIAKQDLA